MVKLLTESFQLGTPDPAHGRVCGNDTIIKSRLCSPPEVAEYYRVRRHPLGYSELLLVCGAGFTRMAAWATSAAGERASWSSVA